MLRYNGATILLQYSVVDFRLDVENMLALASGTRVFWEDY
jgi:hypothetical protein